LLGEAQVVMVGVGGIASKVIQAVNLMEMKEGWVPCLLMHAGPAIWSYALASPRRVQAAHS
jgi:hypothetical protein